MNSFGLQLGLALQGNLDQELEREADHIEGSLQAATFEFGDEIQSKWRQDVGASGLANAPRLTKTIRTRRYRNKGMNPAVLVYSNFPVIQRAFEQSIVIRSAQGAFLLIPNPDVWPGGRARRQGNRSGLQARETTMSVAEQRFGKLRFVYRPGNASLLVAEARATSTGGFRRPKDASRVRRGLTTIIVFFVVRQARTRRMLHGNEIRRRVATQADGRLGQLFLKHHARDGAPRLLTGPAD